LQIGCAGWSIGSILQRRQPVACASVRERRGPTTRHRPVVRGAALIRHEPVHWNGRGVLAIIYLMTFGSVVGYSAYLYALDRLPVAVISIYNYINPLVAVFLGGCFIAKRSACAKGSRC
jgi:drug/metabolite transporter (DMT)-like permease